MSMKRQLRGLEDRQVGAGKVRGTDGDCLRPYE